MNKRIAQILELLKIIYEDYQTNPKDNISSIERLRIKAQKSVYKKRGQDSERTPRAHLTRKHNKSTIDIHDLDLLIKEWLVAGSDDLKNYYLDDDIDPQDKDDIKDFFENNPSGNFSMPEEVNTDEKLYEGKTTSVQVNKYERNPQARKKCIENHGAYCEICEFDFGKKYGDVGKDFIHVHHVKPISQIGENYEIDWKTDLVPVCPNCHAIIHMRQPCPYTIDEVKTFIKNQSSITGLQSKPHT